jgi:hypothetical protein
MAHHLLRYKEFAGTEALRSILWNGIDSTRNRALFDLTPTGVHVDRYHSFWARCLPDHRLPMLHSDGFIQINERDYWQIFRRDPSLLGLPVFVSEESTTDCDGCWLLGAESEELEDYWEAIDSVVIGRLEYRKSTLCRAWPHLVRRLSEGFAISSPPESDAPPTIATIPEDLRANARVCFALHRHGCLPSFVKLERNVFCLADWLLDLLKPSLPDCFVVTTPLW